MPESIKIVKLLSCSAKIRIVCLIFSSRNKICVTDLVNKLEMNRTAVSNHIKELKDAAVIKVSTEGRYNYYRMSDELSNQQRTMIRDIVRAVNADRIKKK